MAAREEIFEPTVEQTYEFFKYLRSEHREAFIDLLNSIRFAELRGAGYLSYLAEVLDDPSMMAKMTKHAADEGKHAHFVTLMIRREGGQPRSMVHQNLFRAMSEARGQRGDGGPPLETCPPREELVEVFASMQAIERSAKGAFQAFEKLYADDEVVLSMVKEVLRDEEFHIGWISKVLDRWRADGLGEQVDDALERGRRALAEARDRSIRAQIEQATGAAS
ncbi:MAG TPA: ferritin-like domain-containing protein [Actinomycetota bacterium]|nr:ferritin-like domain-containing protein [Actinomycetota bacterium]